MAVGSRGSVATAPVAKAGGPAGVRFLVAALGFFSSSWLTNVDGMKDHAIIRG